MSSMMQQGVDPQALIQQLMQGSGGQEQQAPPGQGQSPNGGVDPLQAVQQVIQDLHALVAALPDPGHTRLAAQAMGVLLQIQKELMQGQQQSAQQGGY